MGPSLGWLGGWGIIVADLLVMASLAQIAGVYSFCFNPSRLFCSPDFCPSWAVESLRGFSLLRASTSGGSPAHASPVCPSPFSPPACCLAWAFS
jgi:hypothetical protein